LKELESNLDESLEYLTSQYNIFLYAPQFNIKYQMVNNDMKTISSYLTQTNEKFGKINEYQEKIKNSKA